MTPTRVAAYLRQLLAKRTDVSLRGVYLVLGAGGGVGIALHSLMLDELGLVSYSLAGLLLTLALTATCTVLAVRDMKPAPEK